MSTFQTITYVVDGAVATITLNRPERRNALTSEMLSELYRAFSQAGGDPAVRAIVLTGAGVTFCSGQDLSIFTGQVKGEDVRTAIITYYEPLILRMVSLEKPIIGAINGCLLYTSPSPRD